MVMIGFLMLLWLEWLCIWPLNCSVSYFMKDFTNCCAWTSLNRGVLSALSTPNKVSRIISNKSLSAWDYECESLLKENSCLHIISKYFVRCWALSCLMKLCSGFWICLQDSGIILSLKNSLMQHLSWLFLKFENWIIATMWLSMSSWVLKLPASFEFYLTCYS